MNVVARLRHVLARRPWLYWIGVRARSPSASAPSSPRRPPPSTTPAGHGASRASVVVATADLDPGDALAGVDGDP